MPQRVLCVSVETRVCEETRYLVRLVAGLRERGHEVLCFVPEGGGLVSEAVAGRPWWGLGGWLGERLSHGEWLRGATDFQPTVIQVCDLGALGPARTLASALAAPCVVSLLQVPGRRRVHALKDAADRAPVVLVPAHAHLADWLKAGPLAHAGHSETIIPGVSGISRDEEPQGEDHAPIVGTVADPGGALDVQLLFRAVGLLTEQGVRCECVVLGGDPWDHRLRRRARRLGVREQVTFLPAMMEPGPVLTEVDVVVVLSRRRLRAISILEAQSAGAALVAADVPGIEEFVDDGVTGRILTECTPGALAGLLRELLEDGQLRRTLADEARTRVSRSASLETMLEGFEALYDRLTVDPASVSRTAPPRGASTVGLPGRGPS